MKVLLTTLNSKYIHTALSLRYLYSYCKEFSDCIILQEYTINHHLDYLLGEIYKGEFDIVCFSCYIWNITKTLQVVRNLKKVNPHQIIILGGPEVSFDPVELLKKEKDIDYIIFGEGEETFKELLHYLIRGTGEIEEIKGIAYRSEKNIFQNQDRPLIKNLDTIPSFYLEEGLQDYEHKILYYESSRGCPQNCSYCLSSTIKGVRFFSLERVKKELDLFLKKRVKQVKFIDRTFNAKKSHSLAIMKYIHENDNGYTNFHFEITGDLLDEETINFLATVRKGLFQFEIGIQTTYEKTMENINRKVDFNRLSYIVRQIKNFKNIHLHLDLIAGLPYEDFNRFKKSFNEVYALKPHQLQLGFLKLLKGSMIRKNKDEYGYIFKSEPPYEILQNQFISYEEILTLKRIEEMVDLFYNSHRFEHAINYIIFNFYSDPAMFYQQLASYWEQKGYHHISHSNNALYSILLKFYMENKFKNIDIFREILKFDYILQGKSSLPNYFSHVGIDDFNQRIHRFLQDDRNIKKYLPQYMGVPVKQIIKKVHFENFKYNIPYMIEHSMYNELKVEMTTLLFDYTQHKQIFGKPQYYKVNL